MCILYGSHSTVFTIKQTAFDWTNVVCGGHTVCGIGFYPNTSVFPSVTSAVFHAHLSIYRWRYKFAILAAEILVEYNP